MSARSWIPAFAAYRAHWGALTGRLWKWLRELLPGRQFPQPFPRIARPRPCDPACRAGRALRGSRSGPGRARRAWPGVPAGRRSARAPDPWCGRRTGRRACRCGQRASAAPAATASASASAAASLSASEARMPSAGWVTEPHQASSPATARAQSASCGTCATSARASREARAPGLAAAVSPSACTAAGLNPASSSARLIAGPSPP